MKKILYSLFAITLILTLATSCKDSDPVVNDKGKISSATYHATYKTFTVTYSNGETEDVNAIIDESTTPSSASATLDDGTTIYVTDANQSGKATIGEVPVNEDKNGINTVSQFVYDGMSLYYLWSNEIINKKPTVNDSDPEKYFYSLLNSTDNDYGWSWITDDANSLLSEFEGESANAFGFQPLALYYQSGSNRIVGFVRYVFPDTPAEKAGLKRGDVITHFNGVEINTNNYTVMFGSTSKTTFTVLDQYWENPRQVEITPAYITKDPVLYHNIYQGEGYNGRKVGYLFYTNFTENYNESLHDVFSEFKSAGITDLVLDLRYNPGGGITAATYLASLIAPVDVVDKKSVFTILSYNSYVNGIFDKEKWDRKDYLGDYNTKYPNPLTANINSGNLKLYIIATGGSASASELLAFCLKPYMDVELIGEKTHGKYTASWTLHPYNDYDGKVQPIYKESSLSSKKKKELSNWAMQPITAEYFDKNQNSFKATSGLIPNHPIAATYDNERNTATWKPIGDTNDYLFAKALSLITGKPYEVAQTRRSYDLQLEDANLYSPIESVLREAVIIDNPVLLPQIEK